MNNTVTPVDDANQPHMVFYNRLKEFIKLKIQKPFNHTKVIMLIAYGIRFTAEAKALALTSDQAKDLVMRAIVDVVDASDKITAEDKQLIKDLLDLVGSDVFDRLLEFGNDMKTFIKSKAAMCCSTSKKSVTSYSRAVTRDLGDTSRHHDELKGYLNLLLQPPFDSSKIVTLISAGVKFIESSTDISGVEKKNLVIQVLNEVIMESDRLSEEEKTDLQDMVAAVADSFIDLLVAFGREKYRLFIKKNCRCL